MKRIVPLLALCGLLAFAPRPAQGADWKMDPAGS